MDVRLLLRQKNEVFRLIEKHGLDPARFAWQERRDDRGNWHRLNHVEHEFFIEFERGVRGPRDVWVISYSPAREMRIMQETATNWSEAQLHVRHWLYCLKEELEAPDLWSLMRDYRLAMEGSSNAAVEDNTPFTIEEHTRITEAIEDVKGQLLEKLDLTSEQQEHMHARLDYLVDTSRRVGRKDFFLIAFGLVANWATTQILDPDAARLIWQTLQDAILGAIGLPSP